MRFQLGYRAEAQICGTKLSPGARHQQRNWVPALCHAGISRIVVFIFADDKSFQSFGRCKPRRQRCEKVITVIFLEC